MDIIQQMQQRQLQAITAEQLFSLGLLQMSVLELNSEISRETEENPVLEIDESAGDENNLWPDDDSFLPNKISYKELIHAYEDESYKNTDFADDSGPDDKLAFIKEQKTLKNYLYEQLVDLKINKECAGICRYIIESIDERGYLDYSVSNLAKELKVSKKVATAALNIIKDFQPDGIASKNLEECLKTQLKKNNMDNGELCYIIDNCLELLANNKIKQIAKKTRMTVNEAARCCELIKSLHPYPAKGFYTGNADVFIIPDAYVIESGNKLGIIMNERATPSLIINGVYRDILKNSKDSREREYIKERLYRAAALIKGIENRKSTLTEIFELITRLQEDYLKTGRNLKPMTLKMLGEMLNIHESTVSRAIRGKYLLTPSGLLLVKDLFTSSLELSVEDRQLSSAEVKREIKELIEKEAVNNPLSDRQISNELNRRNIIISRRTVAKYREAMNIVSSSKRKKY